MLSLRTPVLLAAVLLAGCTSTVLHPTSPSATPAPTLPSSVIAPAKALQDDFTAVVRKVGASVVQIETDQGLGSGVVFDGKGNVVTNAHVVEGATTFTVTLSDGSQHDASLVGSFPAGDLAVVHVNASGLTPASLADSSQLNVGDIAIAIGNPLGLRSSVTEGIVSAVGRTVSEGNGFTLPDVIQTSAAINPGNSGGALVDINGNLIGIPTLAAIDQQLGGGAAPGIGFAIPSNTVKDIAQQLIDHGKVVNSHRAYMGVRPSTTFDGRVIIVRVESGSPAEQAGLHQGDQITSVNGHQISSAEDVSTVLAGLKPGDKVDVGIIRDGNAQKVTLTLGELPAG